MQVMHVLYICRQVIILKFGGNNWNHIEAYSILNQVAFCPTFHSLAPPTQNLYDPPQKSTPSWTFKKEEYTLKQNFCLFFTGGENALLWIYKMSPVVLEIQVDLQIVHHKTRRNVAGMLRGADYILKKKIHSIWINYLKWIKSQYIIVTDLEGTWCL